jgi:hypothetical protein
VNRNDVREKPRPVESMSIGSPLRSRDLQRGAATEAPLFDRLGDQCRSEAPATMRGRHDEGSNSAQRGTVREMGDEDQAGAAHHPARELRDEDVPDTALLTSEAQVRVGRGVTELAHE